MNSPTEGVVIGSPAIAERLRMVVGASRTQLRRGIDMYMVATPVACFER